MAVTVEEFFATLGLKVKDQEFKKGEGALDKLTEKLKHGLELFGAFEIGKKLFEWVEGTEEAAVSAEHMATRMGISTQAVQELGYAADVTGVSTGELEASFGKLAASMDEFTTKGKGPAADAFRRLGISAKQLKGESLDQNFELIAQKLSQVSDEGKRISLARDIFGRGGAALLPLMKDGQEGIVALRNEAEDLGVVIGKDDVESFEELEKTQKRVKGAITGIKNEVVIGMLPALKDLADGALEWVKQNRDVIKSGIQGFVSLLVIGLKALAYAFAAVGKVVQFFSDHAEIARAVMIALVAVLGYFAAAAAAAWLAAAAPIIGIVAGIAGLILLVEELVDNWDEVKAAVKRAMKSVVASLKTAWDFIKSIPDKIVGLFEKMGKGIEHVFEGLGMMIRDAFEAVINWIVDKINWVTDKLNVVLDKIPFVDASIGKVGHIGKRGEQDEKDAEAAQQHFQDLMQGFRQNGAPGGGPTAMLAPAVAHPGAAPGGVQQVNTGDIKTTIQINGAGDPKAVALESQKAFDSNMVRVLRHAQSTLGTAGSDVG